MVTKEELISMREELAKLEEQKKIDDEAEKLKAKIKAIKPKSLLEKVAGKIAYEVKDMVSTEKSGDKNGIQNKQRR